ncbi:HET-domain-containing protein, partial [Hyaloscypha variabilis F]
MRKHVNCHYDVPGWESNETVSPRPVPLPTRVIIVDVDNPRLLETKGALGVYAALSHSWGDVHTIRTTRRNFEDHKQHIPLSPIFGTFIDAIATCSVLKIPYLWIDSLCIIQYDETDPLSTRDDSQREIQQMGKIYAQAALTIAATGASDDPTMGLFRGERHRLRQLVEIPLKYSASDKPGEFIYASIKPKTLAEEVSDSRLYTRGWVLQERVLSPRYLHFGREQWFWQCRESTAAESDGIAVVINSPVNAFGADLGMVQAMRGSSDEFSFWWARIVETYTQLDFSYVNDRFDGLRGLMDKLKKETGRQHAWGSWTESLHLQLMWY